VEVNAYSETGRNDADVVGVAWRSPDNLVPVERGSFAIWFDDRESAQVAFTHKDTGERFEGDTDDLCGLVWLEDCEARVSSRVPPDTARWLETLMGWR
jgi:hypothetical protein